jgi:hypothetical protein
MSSFYTYFLVLLQCQTVIQEKLCKAVSYEKAVCKMLVKLTLAFDFTNILCTAFTCAGPKSAKKTDDLTVLFALWGYRCVKGEHKLLKLIPGRHPVNGSPKYSRSQVHTHLVPETVATALLPQGLGSQGFILSVGFFVPVTLQINCC